MRLSSVFDNAFDIWGVDGVGSHEAEPIEMLDLADLLSPADLAKVDPRIIDFYRDPTAFDIRGGVEWTKAGRAVLPFMAMAANQGDIRDQVKGFEDFPMRQTVVVDKNGKAQWHRMVQQNGKWNTLFNARFERDGAFVRETFRRGPIEIPLVFRVTPYRGGIKLTLVQERSSPLLLGQNIVFTTVPTAEGIETNGLLQSALLGRLGDITIKISEPAE